MCAGLGGGARMGANYSFRSSILQAPTCRAHAELPVLGGEPVAGPLKVCWAQDCAGLVARRADQHNLLGAVDDLEEAISAHATVLVLAEDGHGGVRLPHGTQGSLALGADLLSLLHKLQQQQNTAGRDICQIWMLLTNLGSTTGA
jgi:hypothetical protein